MTDKILIKTPEIEMTATLNKSRTAQAIADALPIKGSGNLWGDEIYFSIPVDLPGEDGRETVDKGDLGYWPSGSAFCIFFGPTPASQGDEIRPASAVNVFGKLDGQPEEFKKFNSGGSVVIEKLKETINVILPERVEKTAAIYYKTT